MTQQYPDVQLAIQQVTPERAGLLLAGGGRNRAVSEILIERYARDMRRGAWKPNGEPILVGRDGALLDGQHRLRAIQRSGVTLPLLIVTGLEPEVFDTIDQGRTRTFADVLSIQGDRRHTSGIAATLRYVAAWERADHSLPAMWEGRQRPGGGSWRGKLLTVADIQDVHERHPCIPPLVARVRNSKRLAALMPPSLLTFLLYVFSQRDAAQAERFAGLLETGEGLGAGDPVYQLRERLLALRTPTRAGVRRQVSERLYAGLTVKSWNRARTGRQAMTLAFSADEAVPEAL